MKCFYKVESATSKRRFQGEKFTGKWWAWTLLHHQSFKLLFLEKALSIAFSHLHGKHFLEWCFINMVPFWSFSLDKLFTDLLFWYAIKARRAHEIELQLITFVSLSRMSRRIQYYSKQSTGAMQFITKLGECFKSFLSVDVLNDPWSLSFRQGNLWTKY